MRSREGTPESSAKDTWIPFAASADATETMSPEGACTITPTSGCVVVTWTSSWTCSSLSATAVTSSVDIIHEPMSSNSVSWVANATRRSRQRGIGRTRRGACSTTSTADGWLMTWAASSAAGDCPPASEPSSAKLASTWVRSSSVSFARRSRSSAAIARVFSRA
jgi:hypothetical protein